MLGRFFIVTIVPRYNAGYHKLWSSFTISFVNQFFNEKKNVTKIPGLR